MFVRFAQREVLRAGVCSRLAGQGRWMSSLTFDSFGEPTKVIKAGETVTVDEPAAGQVKVALQASPVTAEDIRCLKGLSVHSSQAGIGGCYGVGTVTSVGEGVASLNSSDKVFVATNKGAWNSEALLNSQEVFAIDSIDASQAAFLSEAASAWALLNNFAVLSAGDVVVRSSETSTLNSAIDQIAKAMGVTVIAASDSDLVDTKFKDKMSSKGTVKLALTSGTGRSARAMLALTGPKGVLVTYNGAVAPLDNNFSGIEVPSLSLIFKDKSICGFDFMAWATESPEEASQAISNSVTLMKEGKLKFSPVAFKAKNFSDAVNSANSGKSAVIEL